jgi:hypothetical protein
MAIEDNSGLLGIINIAQTLLRNQQARGEEITSGLVVEAVAKAANVMGQDDRTDIQSAVAELIRRFSHWIGQDSMLENTEGHVAWLSAERKKGRRYWPRYQGFIERKMPASAIDALDISTDRILGMLEDPHREGAWDRRGLVVGHVQSGKTGNYSGLVNKAADAGYKIIIVLAGLHNNLRSQTQIRLEESFLGFETSAVGDNVKLIGVGVIDSDIEIRPNCATNRTNKGDFNTKAEQHLAISPGAKPWLFVVKKHKKVLDTLIDWIGKHVADATEASTGRRFVSNLPLLVIDDESDQASVDTGEQEFDGDGIADPNHEPKAINGRIRKILHLFAKSAYVGYTATPFANIFIHRRNVTREEGDDLFPQSFIVNLAAPSNYVGPSKVFGVLTPDGRDGGLPLARTISDHVELNQRGKESPESWMPSKHKGSHLPYYKGVDSVPPSLREAIYAFVLACAVREIRGQGAEHSSMLVHVTRLNAIQVAVHRQVSDVVTGVRQRITRRVDHEGLLAELKALWEGDFVPTSEMIKAAIREQDGPMPVPEWEAVLDKLADVLSDIQVRMVNGTAKDALDYAEPRAKGLRIIAIGGDKLARGLTLEGLSVSYFVRATKMYDTLMQMGRWFGYRPGYIDLCRLYTSVELVEWFEHIADASEELRDEFDMMAESGATPSEYGLKVQSHPVLLVTSPLKMRTTKNLQLSFSGDSVETVSLYRSRDMQKRNLDAVNKLILAMGSPTEPDPIRMRGGVRSDWDGTHLWNNVSYDKILGFLQDYSTHPEARKVNSNLLTEFVQKMAVDAHELTSWTVVVLNGGEGKRYEFAGGVVIKNMPERKPDPLIADRYSIGRLLSPRDEAIDLDDKAWTAALDITVRAKKPDPGRQKDGALPTIPTTPNGPAIRRVRGEGVPTEGVAAAKERGLLLIYPLDPDTAEAEDRSTPVIAFGASFPRSKSGTKVEYRVDHLLWEREYDSAN